MHNHLYLPLLIPLFGALLAIVFTRKRRLARRIIIATIAGHLVYSTWLMVSFATNPAVPRQVAFSGGWVAPFGISLVADPLSAIMLFLAGLLMLTTLIFGFATLDRRHEHFFFYPMLLLLLFGVSGAFITGDLFNLYVWFEVLLVASFGLLTLGCDREQAEGGLKYVIINLIGSTLFLIGCGLVYGVAGTLNMAHIAERFAGLPATEPTFITVLALLFIVAYGIKAALFPLFFWLPTSYHTPPIAVTAIFGGLLTKVGVYSLYRVLGLIYNGELPTLSPLLLILAALTMVVGVLGAVAQMNVRRILSFHIVSQIGYMIMGLGLASVFGLAAGILFMVHNIIVKTALFLIGGAAEYISGTGDIKKMGGLAKREPLLAGLWMLAILSLAGIPPLSGFFGKLALLQAAITQEQYLIGLVATVVSILTFFSMLKIWNEVFWKQLPESAHEPQRATPGLIVPGAILVVMSLLMGFGAGPAMDYSMLAADQALDVSGYVTDVCGADGCEPPALGQPVEPANMRALTMDIIPEMSE